MKQLPKHSREKPKYWLWIIVGIVVISGIGLTVYLVSQSSSQEKTPDNTHNLPSHAKAEQEINEIKSLKGLDEQQATIEFLARYVPQIKWWEINSLSELDEKIDLVNSKCRFPPLKSVPNNQQSLDDFNIEWKNNFLYRNLAFLATICPRQSDGSIDWKGKTNFSDYLALLKPELESYKYKPAFANEKNYQEINHRIYAQINELIMTCRRFSDLADVEGLNKLIDKYLGLILGSIIYAETHDDFAKQLNLTSHKKWELKLSGTNQPHHGWGVQLYGYVLTKN